MTNDDILDGLFHCCAFAAFLEEAHAQQGWPDIEATRRRAYAYYEQELAVKNRHRDLECQSLTLPPKRAIIGP